MGCYAIPSSVSDSKLLCTSHATSLKKSAETKRCYLFHNSLFQQAVLLGRHDEVVRLVLVVHDVLQPDARLVLQVEEELLVEYEGHATDLLNVGLSGGVAVDEVSSNPNGNLSPELLSRKSFYKRKNILCNINNTFKQCSQDTKWSTVKVYLLINSFIHSLIHSFTHSFM